MKLKKLLMLCLCASFGIATVNAADLENALAVTLKDNTVEKYFLSDKPIVTFSGIDLKITTGDVEISYPLLNVVDAKYVKGDKSGVAGIEDNSYRFDYTSKDCVEISNLVDCNEVAVYTTDGKLAGSYNVTDGKCYIDLTNNAKGVYVIKAGNKPAVKVIK